MKVIQLPLCNRAMKVLTSKDKNKKEFRHPLLKIVYEDALYHRSREKEGLPLWLAH